MTADVSLAVAVGVLFSIGVYLMMSRNMIRILLGYLVVGHGTNLLLLEAGAWGEAPIVGEGAPSRWSDPLPQAFVLTSIVITLAVAAFMLAMVYRGFLHTRDADIAEPTADDFQIHDGGEE